MLVMVIYLGPRQTLHAGWFRRYLQQNQPTFINQKLLRTKSNSYCCHHYRPDFFSVVSVSIYFTDMYQIKSDRKVWNEIVRNMTALVRWKGWFIELVIWKYAGGERRAEHTYFYHLMVLLLVRNISHEFDKSIWMSSNWEIEINLSS